MLASMQRSFGEDGAVFYAIIYQEWGDRSRALENLETAMRHRSPDLWRIRTDFGSLRNEPRFQAIAKALDFPD